MTNEPKLTLGKLRRGLLAADAAARRARAGEQEETPMAEHVAPAASVEEFVFPPDSQELARLIEDLETQITHLESGSQTAETERMLPILRERLHGARERQSASQRTVATPKPDQVIPQSVPKPDPETKPEPSERQSWVQLMRKRLKDAVANFPSASQSPTTDTQQEGDALKSDADESAAPVNLDLPPKAKPRIPPAPRPRKPRSSSESTPAHRKAERSSFEDPEVRALLDQLQPYFEKLSSYIEKAHAPESARLQVEKDLRLAEGIVADSEWEMPEEAKRILTSLVDILSRYELPVK